MMEGTQQESRRFEEAMHLRMNHIEKENQRLRRLIMVLGVALAGVTGLASMGLIQARSSQTQRVVQATEFRLTGEDGVPRGMWRLLEDGTSSLTLNDQNGLGRVRFAVLPDGAPGVSFTDAKGKSRVVISLLPDMTGTLVFADESGTTRTVLGLAADGSSTLMFADAAGTARASIGVAADGVPDFSIIDNVRAQAEPDTTPRQP